MCIPTLDRMTYAKDKGMSYESMSYYWPHFYRIGPFMSSYGMKYVLVIGDYVPNCLEEIGLLDNEGKSVTTFLKKNVF